MKALSIGSSSAIKKLLYSYSLNIIELEQVLGKQLKELKYNYHEPHT